MLSDDIQETLFRPLKMGRLKLRPDSSLLFVNPYLSPDTELRSFMNHLQGDINIVSWQPERHAAIDAGLQKAVGGGERLDHPELHNFLKPLLNDTYDFILFNLYREVDRTTVFLDQLLRQLKEDGIIICSAANKLGAKKFEGIFQQRFRSPISSLSKNKCRVMWGSKNNLLDQLPTSFEQRQSDIEGGYATSVGAFSAQHIDPGSEVLIDTFVSHSKIARNSGKNRSLGSVFDLGAGWGYLVSRLLKLGLSAEYHLFESDLLSLEAAKKNLGPYENVHYHWADVIRETPRCCADLVIMNPPFHSPTEVSSDIGRNFIKAAADALRPQSTLWMVANVHLPYEKILDAEFSDWEQVVLKDGFKVIRATTSK